MKTRVLTILKAAAPVVGRGLRTAGIGAVCILIAIGEVIVTTMRQDGASAPAAKATFAISAAKVGDQIVRGHVKQAAVAGLDSSLGQGDGKMCGGGDRYNIDITFCSVLYLANIQSRGKSISRNWQPDQTFKV